MAFAVAGLVLPKRPSRISDLSEGAHLSQFTGAGPLPRGKRDTHRSRETDRQTDGYGISVLSEMGELSSVDGLNQARASS